MQGRGKRWRRLRLRARRRLASARRRSCGLGAAGAAAIEFAIMLPLMVVLTAAILQYGIFWAQCNADAKAAEAVAEMAADVVAASPGSGDGSTLQALFQTLSHADAAHYALTVTAFTLGGTGPGGGSVSASSSVMLSAGTLSSTDPSAVPQITSSPVPLLGGDIVIVVEVYRLHDVLSGVFPSQVSYERRIVRAREPTPWPYVEIEEVGNSYVTADPSLACVWETWGDDASGSALTATFSASTSDPSDPASQMADGNGATFGCTDPGAAQPSYWTLDFTGGAPSSIFIDPYCDSSAGGVYLTPTLEVLVSWDGVAWAPLKTVAVPNGCVGAAHHGAEITLAIP